MKKNILIFLLVTAVCVAACAQSSLSGRYVTDDEDSIYQYFEFSGSRVRIGIEFLGYTQRISASYKIEDGSVIIYSSEGEIELEIIDSNTLIGVGFGVDDITFTKAGGR
jgi:hypothetical protein